jgi:hypothetical protein
MKTIVKAIRIIVNVLKLIPLLDLIVYIVADACYFLLDKVGLTIGTFIRIPKGNGSVGSFWKDNAVMKDKCLNVSCQDILNAVMIKGPVEPHFKFGNQFSTVSDQMGRLQKMTAAGRWSKDVFLDTIEDNHCAKAVELNNTALLKRVEELKLFDK